MMQWDIEYIAEILTDRDIAAAVRELRAEGHLWSSIERVIVWSESEGRLSKERVLDRTRQLSSRRREGGAGEGPPGH